VNLVVNSPNVHRPKPNAAKKCLIMPAGWMGWRRTMGMFPLGFRGSRQSSRQSSRQGSQVRGKVYGEVVVI
jgi:hypothetical protein